MNKCIKTFLSNNHNAPEITHFLSTMDGSGMQNGIKYVWMDGCKYGFKSGVAISVILGIATLSVHKVYDVLQRRRDTIVETLCENKEISEEIIDETNN